MNTAATPLYVRATERIRVCLDGPALRFRKRHSDDSRFPLKRVSRVVVFGEVDWAAEALLACGAAGIVVCALGSDGLPCRRWIGEPSSRSTFSEDWRHFLERPGSHDAYRQWAFAWRRRAIGLCSLRMGLGGRGGGRVLRAVRRWATHDAGFRAEKRVFYGLAYARCLEELAKLGCCDADRSLEVVAPDLVTVIQWGLHPNLARDGSHGRIGRCATDLVRLFEGDRMTTDFHLRQALLGLARLIREKA